MLALDVKRTYFGLPTPLALYIGATAAVAAPLLLAAAAVIAANPPSATTGAELALFFALALVADLKPVPMDETGKSEVSIAGVFIVTAAVLFGWQYASLLAAASVGATFFIFRRPGSRLVFNVSMYALAAAAAALPVAVVGHLPGNDRVGLTACVLAAGALHLVTNVALVSGAFTLSQGVRYRTVVIPGLRQGGAAFAIMAFLAALAANLWVIDAWMIVLLAGPLFTLTLYQRSALSSRVAARDARTDNLTGLGNHRAYQAKLRELIADCEKTALPFSLCLVDVDNFKAVNDTCGHPVGDDVLVGIAEVLKSVLHAEAYRFGGDEFAVLVAADEMHAFRELERVQRTLATLDLTPGAAVTVSVGIASFPAHADSADELQRAADGALYWAKAHGKNRACLYSPSVIRVFSPAELQQEAERSARLRAAQNLVRFVDARDPSTATHSEVVSSLAEGIARELGLDEQLVDQLRLAGLLHDIGKIGLPDAILRAPRKLTDHEYAIVKRHPEFGFSLLEGLGVEPVEEWVLHHHEHWNGSGYPTGLAGTEIPFGARVILVADAFEAMTADRPYREAQSPDLALEELRRYAGVQFDPQVVAALERHLTAVPASAELAEAR
jgi:diguanylate cyclase (GGDEF)-like protein/putative nucleotidyltransferase with HDIG domain